MPYEYDIAMCDTTNAQTLTQPDIQHLRQHCCLVLDSGSEGCHSGVIARARVSMHCDHFRRL